MRNFCDHLFFLCVACDEIDNYYMIITEIVVWMADIKCNKTEPVNFVVYPLLTTLLFVRLQSKSAAYFHLFLLEPCIKYSEYFSLWNPNATKLNFKMTKFEQSKLLSNILKLFLCKLFSFPSYLYLSSGALKKREPDQYYNVWSIWRKD